MISTSNISLPSFVIKSPKEDFLDPFFFLILGASNITVPSGKHTKNYGRSPFSMGKSTISMVIFNSNVQLPEGLVIPNTG